MTQRVGGLKARCAKSNEKSRASAPDRTFGSTKVVVAELDVRQMRVRKAAQSSFTHIYEGEREFGKRSAEPRRYLLGARRKHMEVDFYCRTGGRDFVCRFAAKPTARAP